MRLYENIRKIATCQGDDYTTGYLLYYTYFKNCYKMRAIDLSKQKQLHDDHKKLILLENVMKQEMQQCFFIIEEARKTILYFSQGAVRVL